ncbi:MAG: M20/M25/M40 family metallo-hydrolase [Anaerolineae bacterium]|nr:M20/M25/M40 family metallo-hydrolase [Anaerolineae bacterium]
MKHFLPHFENLLGQMTWRLSSLVEAETPTNEKSYVDELGTWLAGWAQEQGAVVTVHPHPIVGDFVECRWNPDSSQKPILILCHMDTVHPLGSVEKHAARLEEDVLFGMGAYDMKASIVLVQTVLEQLKVLKQALHRPITVLFTSDEEIGSPYSRKLITKLAKQACLVLVMEFCNYEESIVTERKGVGIFQITAIGREAHSGSAPHEGLNAVIEIARLVEKVAALTDEEKGTLVTPAVIRGGTRHNVIPGECDLVINVRARYHSEAHRVEEALNTLVDAPAFIPGVEKILTGEFKRPPMERDAVMIATFQKLQEVVGVPLRETSRGGGSDGNFSAALGIPTLDGLGAAGEGAHAATEQVYLPSLPRRAALLASILCGWPES